MSDVGTIKDKYRALAGRLDEATLRLWAAVEARTLGRGGVSTVAQAIGMSRTTIHAGLRACLTETRRRLLVILEGRSACGRPKIARSTRMTGGGMRAT